MKGIFKRIIVSVLTLEARLVLKKYKPRVIGITGSVGKTSAKDAIYTVLASKYYVRKSDKSFNSEIGVPLTILGCDNAWSNPFLWMKNIVKGLGVLLLPNHYPRWLVLEIGLDRPGDISRTVEWLKLDIAVLTTLPKTPVHVEFFTSVKQLHEEKKAILKGLRGNGVLITNADDDTLRMLQHPGGGRRITYGYHEGADVRVGYVHTSTRNKYPTGITFKITHAGRTIPVALSGVLGRQHIYPSLIAASVGVARDINLVETGQALTGHAPAPGRMRLLEGIKGSVIVDDTYNSSPAALKEALRAIEELEIPGRKVAVLGDMMELGDKSVSVHKEIGRQVASVAGLLVVVGPRARYFAEGAREAGMSGERIIERGSSFEVAGDLPERIEEGDLILLKGSQSVRMERITKALLENPERAGELLVRQDKIWLSRP